VAITPTLVYVREGDSAWWLAKHWDLTSLAVSAIPTVIFVMVAWRRRTAATIMLAATALFALATSVKENIFRYPADLPSLLPYAWVPMYLTIGWILVDEFLRSLNESERLNVELKWRMAQTMAQLELSHQRIEYVERQKVAVLEERKRIMSEMHDGVGAQLITTLTLLENGGLRSEEVAAALRECLDDLRLAIDSLEPAENDLLPVLGNLRYRLEGGLQRCGIALDWQVSDVPKLSCLTPQNVLHILRILQEAFANVLKHAHASVVKVETGIDGAGTGVYIRVSDNGTGFSGSRTGRGMVNMRRRAQSIGAGLEILASPAGTVLCLILPMG
jgi:signal transduction histidine kinase